MSWLVAQANKLWLWSCHHQAAGTTAMCVITPGQSHEGVGGLDSLLILILLFPRNASYICVENNRIRAEEVWFFTPFNRIVNKIRTVHYVATIFLERNLSIFPPFLYLNAFLIYWHDSLLLQEWLWCNIAAAFESSPLLITDVVSP